LLFAASLVLSAFGIPKPNSNAFWSVEGKKEKRKKKAKRREKRKEGEKEKKVQSSAPYHTVRQLS